MTRQSIHIRCRNCGHEQFMDEGWLRRVQPSLSLSSPKELICALSNVQERLVCSQCRRRRPVLTRLSA